jgi:hypothetical protein
LESKTIDAEAPQVEKRHLSGTTPKNRVSAGGDQHNECRAKNCLSRSGENKSPSPRALAPPVPSATQALRFTVIVSEAFARSFSANQDPLGKHMGDAEGQESDR